MKPINRSLRLSFVLSLAVALIWPAPGARASEKQGVTVVTMNRQSRYVPQKITVTAGQTVEWKNASNNVHTVTDEPDQAVYPADASLPGGAHPFDSGDIEPGGTYQHTFTVPGLYKYFCAYHETIGMVGEVEVKPSSGK